MSGHTLWWVALGLFIVGAARAELGRMNDPHEPIIPRGFMKLKHARLGAPWIAAGVVMFLIGAVIRLLG
ncbi:MAG: hypothetical protein WCD35_08675 [Mycobacteriales bacterium]